MAQRHRQKIEDQLADAMVMLANAVRAGLSLAQSLEILAAQCPKPINAEFHQIVAEYNLGKPLERTLVEAKQRLQSENFALFAAALLASHESGGRLNETVERIAQSVLELQRLERKVLSETAQARKSAVYMAIAPAVILVVYYFVDPENTTLLFTGVAGPHGPGDGRGLEPLGVPLGASDPQSGLMNCTKANLLASIASGPRSLWDRELDRHNRSSRPLTMANDPY